MDLHEANARLRKVELTEHQLRTLSPVYVLLDLDKDDFCKIVDAVGLDVLTSERFLRRVEWLGRAEQELMAKERYLKAKARLESLELEKAELEEVVNGYSPF